jgi:hypothetical protein
MKHKKVNKYNLFKAIVFLNLLLLMSCVSSDNQDLYQSASDTLEGIIADCGLEDKARVSLPYLMHIDSLWAYYDVDWTTSGRCNRPDFFDDDSSMNLSYGFYVVLDHRSGCTSNVADVVVSYRKNAFWGSSDTTQKIRIIHVKDSLFALPIASFHVKDPICNITDRQVLKKGNHYCYSGERCCYVVESCHDTIQHFFVFPSNLICDWDRVIKYVESH